MDAAALVQPVLAALGKSQSTFSHLAGGLSSDAWLVEAAGGEQLVLRVARSTDRGSELELEHEILHALTAAGAAVPAPVVGSWEVPGWSGLPFSVTTFVAGAPVEAAEVIDAAPDIATFLSTLHALVPPAATPDVTRRFARAPIWPMHRATVAGHPVQSDPALVAGLAAVADRVRRAQAGPAVLVHSDLHNGNVLWTGTRAAFIDFGCAFAGSAQWDHAALAFFLGWPVAERVIALSGATVEAADVRLVALSFALYRWAVAGDDEDADHSAGFIRATLRSL